MKLVSLKNKKEIDTIFSDKAFSIYNKNVKLRAIKSDATKILISVPSRLFARAVDRNYIKRVIKDILKDKNIVRYNIAFIYNSDKILSYKEIKEALEFLLSKLK